ncbi:MAG: hypothetical protein ACPGQD_01275 [Planctomycetota bacterium]
MPAETLIVVGIVASLAAGAGAWVVRGAIDARVPSPKAQRWHWLIRLVAVLIGAVAGVTMEGWPQGFWVGFGAGSITTTGVWVQRMIQRRLDAPEDNP